MAVRTLGRRLLASFKKSPIRVQIILSMTVVSLLVMALLGFTISDLSKQIIENDFQENHQFIMELTDEVLTMQLKVAVDLSRNLLADESFTGVLLGESSSTAYFSAANQNRLQEILSEIMDFSIVQEIIVVSEGGQTYYTTKYAQTLQLFNHYYTTDSLLDEDWTVLADAQKGKELFFGYNVILGDDKPNSFSMVKKLIEPFTGNSMGYLVINFRKTLISSIFNGKSLDYNSNSFLVVDLNAEKSADADDVQVIYYKGDEDYREAILAAYRNGEESEYVFTSYHNDLTGWDIIGIVRKSELTRQSTYINWITIMAGIGLALLQILLATLLARQISHPLSMLETTMQEVVDGNRNITVQFDDTDVGRIGNQFKHLVNDNLKLAEQAQQMELKEAEAELLLLQSQINPHFLYNTLDNIYMHALVKEEDEIAEMICNLSELFRLSLNAGKKLISVSNELRHIEMYMNIQSSRFRDRYRLRVDVEEELRSQQILVFILQPLVENAVLHGLEPKLGTGQLGITGKACGEGMVFTVEDDGVGLEDMQRLSAGYGIRNIRERLLLFYGEGRYQLKFESRAGEGTRVTLYLPRLPQKEGMDASDCSD